MMPQLVFGWPALREKLIGADLALDDMTLELLKIMIMRDVQGPPMADQTELRLTGGDGETLDFSWVVSATEARLASLPVPREIYEDVAGDPRSWEALRSEFTGHLFVDLKRLVAGPG